MTETPKTAKCLRCGRVLRSAASIAAGYGPTCGRKIRAAAATVTAAKLHKAVAVAKAMELIELGGIVPVRTRRTPVFRTVSSDGTGSYLTARQACTCAAGLKGRYTCYHRVAVELIAA
jgi:hypothetical protein